MAVVITKKTTGVNFAFPNASFLFSGYTEMKAADGVLTINGHSRRVKLNLADGVTIDETPFEGTLDELVDAVEALFDFSTPKEEGGNGDGDGGEEGGGVE